MQIFLALFESPCAGETRPGNLNQVFLWFTMFNTSKIGRISTGGEVTSFAAGMTPVGITTGKDGAIWFAGYHSDSIGRLTTDGELSQIKIQTPAGTPYHITMGEESLWFTEIFGNKIGQIQLSSP